MVWTVWKGRTYDYRYCLSTTERPINSEARIHFSVFCHWAISPSLLGVACERIFQARFGFALAPGVFCLLNNFVPAVPSKLRTDMTPAFFNRLM